ncbi:extracellular solute-binding protein [Frigoribacterium sp. RIT-PI-h]|uniref:extracellular solute-binding protein n=1 Tax=Frigoribacterium sp. RIT-PI-h TaxID=1690245 RepID=UPI0006B8C347|nr:extracellular solute-binding protein [Frigoribacterium sp. RIT-PI-h]KPG76942.1 sugar ABC transporter substrate-binding protein [Frigoribacterium sp. RIT-PI-h]
MSRTFTSARGRKRALAVAAAAVATALLASGCSGGAGSGDSDTIKVAYQKFGTFTQMDAHMKETAKTFEAANPGMKVEFVPIAAQNDDYFTKLALMNRSAATAPDVMYEDTFKVKSDAAAGYLLPLDEYTDAWDDWEKFYDNAKEAGVGEDGKTYGIPMGTDTRALWYNKDLFAQAGLPVPWEPKTWQDVLDAAETVKAKVPDVVPLNVYSGKPQGEGATMQGFEMLLYGTPTGTLYDDETGKWLTDSQGFVDSLGFIEDVYQGGIGPKPEEALDTNIATIVGGEWLPQGKLAIALDGSWMSGTWLETGTNPWPEWNDVMGQAPMPTQDGAKPGATSMSGGWTLAVGSKTKNPDKAFEFIADALDKDGSQSYDIAASQIAVRSDVAEDPEYVGSNPTFAFFSSIVPVTHFRPATTDYSRISNEITVAMEAVMTGQQSPEEAAAAFDDQLVGIVGEDQTQKAGD